MLLSDQGWLWARGFEGGGPHVAALPAHRPLADEGAGTRGGAPDRRRARHDARRHPPDHARRSRPGARSITPSGKAITAAARLRRNPASSPARAEVDEIGLYQVGNGDLSTLAHVGPVNAPEFADTVSTEDVLRPAAEATGGSRAPHRIADRRCRCPASCRCAARANAVGQRLDRPEDHRRQRAEIGQPRAALRRLLRPRRAAARDSARCGTARDGSIRVPAWRAGRGVSLWT